MAKKKEEKKGNTVSYKPGNGEQILVTLLIQIAQKLDNIQNHTATLVDMNMEEQEKKEEKTEDENG